MKRLFEVLFWIYRTTISPFFHFVAGPSAGCRFDPTCSQYAKEVLQTERLMRAANLITRRILRCHPWGGHGYDPAPKNG